jgi:putative DNA methylase
MRYPKRLIEVDLPIREISAHARREKSIRHGHIATLHIWWARRPLAACRAVICASLWPDPVDDLCPQAFRDAAAKILSDFAEKARTERRVAELVQKHFTAWNRTKPNTLKANNPGHWPEIRHRLLDFIADFANWDASTVPEFLETSRALTQAAHEALGGEPGTRPLLVDPFAGGGAIPLEALRVGTDAFASDLNPVAVLLNKVALEYIPKYGNAEIAMKDAEGNDRTFHGLAEAVRYWGNWVKVEAEKELAEFYPKDPDGAIPIAYLWARTIKCEGPGCGAEVPLMRSLWLAKKSKNSVGLKIVSEQKTKGVSFKIIHDASTKTVGEGTINKGSTTCPVCKYTTPVGSVRKQLSEKNGGTESAKLIAVRYNELATGNRSWRLANEEDIKAYGKAKQKLSDISNTSNDYVSLPNEPLPPIGTLGFRVQRYGILSWKDLYLSRQLLAILELIKQISILPIESSSATHQTAIRTCLSIALSRFTDFCSAQCVLNSTGGRGVVHVFGRQALPMVWDFMETNPFNDDAANWENCLNAFINTAENEKCNANAGIVERESAVNHSLSDDCCNAFITDPPYYDSVPYADLSDYFYIWLKRMVGGYHHNLFNTELTPKDEECIVDGTKNKTSDYFEKTIEQALGEGRRILMPSGIGVIVFAHKSTSGWEALLSGMISAGWIITGSWPIDTERPGRLRAQKSAALASSVHLVCRPRENPDGSVREDDIGDWRDVLAELPKRIHEWMPRLAREGIVGADAIFACLGPALEVFSKYSAVEKPSGEQVTLKEYLEHVWAAVSKEALNMIFEGADATGLEEDARLTAMWLWTLSTGGANGGEEESDDGKTVKSTGYELEYDSARKIAQGLGAHLENLDIVEVKGDKAKLVPVEDRARKLFGKEDITAPRKKKKKEKQMSLFAEVEQAESAADGWDGKGVAKIGETALDKVHQSMILFALGRSEALKRFLVEDGVGQDSRFWDLAQSLSALYPPQTDEKRWVDGVLARKKGLGF